MTPDSPPLPPLVLVGALLTHIMDSLTESVPPPLALVTDGSKVMLLDGQRLRSTSSIDVPSEAPDATDLLQDAAVRILDEVQDLVMSATSTTWPPGPASHPAAAWTDQGTLRLGYFPAGDLARTVSLAVPDYRPPMGPPRVAG